MTGRPVEYDRPRVQILVRLQTDDLLILKVEARHLGISLNRLVERALQDWIIREAGDSPRDREPIPA